MATDWFRRTTWTPTDAADFTKRLARSRPHNRPQYLRIQAVHLAEAEPPHWEAALQLLDRLIHQYPDQTQLAQAHFQRAECLLALSRADEAIEAFREAMATERRFPNSRTTAYLAFAYWIATTGRVGMFEEALDVLEEFGNDEVFPMQLYLHNAALALIAASSGDKAVARDAARRALHASQRLHSGFRYHPHLGLVAQSDRAVAKQLTDLAAG